MTESKQSVVTLENRNKLTMTGVERVDAFSDRSILLTAAGGKVRISCCCNDDAARQLEALIRAEYPDADIACEETTALCSFYAEEGGMIVGYEDANA